MPVGRYTLLPKALMQGGCTRSGKKAKSGKNTYATIASRKSRDPIKGVMTARHPTPPNAEHTSATTPRCEALARRFCHPACLLRVAIVPDMAERFDAHDLHYPRAPTCDQALRNLFRNARRP